MDNVDFVTPPCLSVFSAYSRTLTFQLYAPATQVGLGHILVAVNGVNVRTWDLQHINSRLAELAPPILLHFLDPACLCTQKFLSKPVPLEFKTESEEDADGAGHSHSHSHSGAEIKAGSSPPPPQLPTDGISLGAGGGGERRRSFGDLPWQANNAFLGPRVSEVKQMHGNAVSKSVKQVSTKRPQKMN